MVRFDSVNLRYPGAGRRPGPMVLRDLTFEIPAGSFHCLLGQNGSGKTSLLRLMSLTLRPSEGDVMVLGCSSRSRDGRAMGRCRQRIGFISPDLGLIRHLSVYDNVALPLRLHGGPEARVRAEVTELLNWLGLTAQLMSMPDALTGWERQIALIARAAISRPQLLLADEPTVGLDAAQANRVMHLLFELNRLGATVVIAPQDPRTERRSNWSTLTLADGMLRDSR